MSTNVEFNAQFTGSNGTTASSYTPDIGTWVEHPTSAGTDPVIFNNTMRATQQTTLTRWMSGADVSNPALPVPFGVNRLSDSGMIDVAVGLNATLWTCYIVRPYLSGGMAIHKYINGTPGSPLVTASAPGDTIRGTIQRTILSDRVRITVTLDGEEDPIMVCEDTDSDRITAAGRVGAQWYETASPSNSTGMQLDYLAAGVDLPFAVSEPRPYQVFQRRGVEGTIYITGTCGPDTTTIEASWNGGPYETISTTQVSGIFTGTLRRPKGQGTLTVRDADDHGNSIDIAYVGVGQVLAISGQSNAVGLGTNLQSYSHATLKACVFKNDYTVAELEDPVDDPTGQIDTVSDDSGIANGSYWPIMVTALMAALDEPIMLIPCATSSASITQWQPSGDHEDRGTLYGSMIHRIRKMRGCAMVCWHQGEGEALVSMSQATYNGYIDTLANAVFVDVHARLMPCLLQHSTALSPTDEQKIRDAVVEAAGDNHHVRLGPDLSGITSDDAYHIQGNGKLATAGNAWSDALLPYLRVSVLANALGGNAGGHILGL
jgi:hypothetical protein